VNSPVITDVKTRFLGRTGLSVSEIGFGTWGLGGNVGGAVAYGPADDVESLRALRQALESGITFYETADLYGFGHSEQLLGQAFAARRQEVIIATKAGIVTARGEQDFSEAHLRAALAGSRKRLQTDYVDAFLLHNPPLALFEQNPQLIAFMESLQREGQIRAWGVSLRSPNDGPGFITRFGCPIVQVNFNLTDQRARQNGLLDLCAQQQTGCIIRTPLCFGFLTGQYGADTDFNSADHRRLWAPEQRRLWADASRAFNAAVNPIPEQTPAQIALRFCLSYPGVSTTIPGMLTDAHVRDNAGASRLGPLCPDERIRLEQLYEQHSFFLAETRPAQQDATT
jgi:aryl-alcohol dehydrogenase-like predicted oxidoreductase